MRLTLETLDRSIRIPMITLDIVVPTYNRCKLLLKAVRSLMEAEVPVGLLVTIIVVDNNCTDDTASIIQRINPTSSVRLQ